MNPHPLHTTTQRLMNILQFKLDPTIYIDRPLSIFVDIHGVSEITGGVQSNRLKLLPYISPTVLHDLLPKIFPKNKNPKYKEITDELYERLDSDYTAVEGLELGQSSAQPPDLATALLHRYLDYTDGQSWFERNQVEVLEDLIKEIKIHYKLD